MFLYQFNKPIIKATDTMPDPAYNPNEITRVKDILDLHKRGLNVSIPASLRGSFDDDRSDYTKLSSPNLESDKLFPSIPRLVAQNAHYKSTLLQRQKDLEESLRIEKLREELDSSINSSDTSVSGSDS